MIKIDECDFKTYLNSLEPVDALDTVLGDPKLLKKVAIFFNIKENEIAKINDKIVLMHENKCFIVLQEILKNCYLITKISTPNGVDKDDIILAIKYLIENTKEEDIDIIGMPNDSLIRFDGCQDDIEEIFNGCLRKISNFTYKNYDIDIYANGVFSHDKRLLISEIAISLLEFSEDDEDYSEEAVDALVDEVTALLRERGVDIFAKEKTHRIRKNENRKLRQ